jgi:hypothetical protein
MAKNDKPSAPAPATDVPVAAATAEATAPDPTAAPNAPPPAAPAEPATVAMVRAAPAFAGGPVTADVHPDEVGGWLASGWTVAK